jgi:hypothetical protein
MMWGKKNLSMSSPFQLLIIVTFPFTPPQLFSLEHYKYNILLWKYLSRTWLADVEKSDKKKDLITKWINFLRLFNYLVIYNHAIFLKHLIRLLSFLNRPGSCHTIILHFADAELLQ